MKLTTPELLEALAIFGALALAGLLYGGAFWLGWIARGARDQIEPGD